MFQEGEGGEEVRGKGSEWWESLGRYKMKFKFSESFCLRSFEFKLCRSSLHASIPFRSHASLTTMGIEALQPNGNSTSEIRSEPSLLCIMHSNP